MARFLAGFVTASLGWIAVIVLSQQGLVELPQLSEGPVAVDLAKEEADEATPEESASPRRRRRRRRGRSSAMGGRMGARLGNGEASSGDDLGEAGPREINAAGTAGEAQLSSNQIEGVFDSSFGGIQRCLVLVPPEENPQGRITFGLRVSGSGQVSRVNLRGPASVTRSEAGTCLRRIARGLRFPAFDGPDMTFSYPITLQ